jgi:ketosteroid isomerase-like protein
MSHETIALINRGLEAYNRRDVDALLEYLDPEIEWYPVLPRMLGGTATVYRGHAGMRQFFKDVDDSLANVHVEYSEIRDLGDDRAVAIGWIRSRGRASGVETESPVAAVYDLRDGKALRIRTYLDPKEALEAAGLSE